MKTIRIIPSKSDAHRAYIASALSFLQKNEKEGAFSDVVCNESSEDIEATKSCLMAILSEDESGTGANLYCGESGTTLRFLLPLVGALGIRGIFHPEGRLSRRPISPLREELCNHGMNISEEGSIPLIAEGKLSPGIYIIPGNISSQFISGLLFALPLLDEESELIIEGEIESSPYVDMTLRTLQRYGIEIEESKASFFDDCGEEKRKDDKIFFIKGNQVYNAKTEYNVEGDWSNAAFWFAIGAIGREPIRIEGLTMDSAQGDKSIIEVLRAFGAELQIGEDDSVTVYPSRERMKGITWDVEETPDMVPVLALLGALSKGTTKIRNARRLRLKESDRLHTISVNLHAMGVRVDELEDGLIIHGVDELKSATVEGHSDHRIVMMAAAAATSLRDDNKISLIGHEAAQKSYPTFFDRLSEFELDGNLELI